MAARVSLVLVFVLMLALVLAATEEATTEAAAGGGALLVNKCCPPGAQLTAMLHACAPLPAAPPAESSLARETAAAALLRAGESGVPWWLNASVAVHDPVTLAPRRGAASALLRGAPRGALVRYGQRPCAASATLHIFTYRQSEFQLLANGSLLLLNVRRARAGADAQAQVALPPEEWCSDREQYGRIVLLTCPCRRVTCVQWCCNRDQAYNVQATPGLLQCQKRPALPQWAPSFHEGRSPAAAPDVLYAARYGRPPVCDAAFDKYLLNSKSGNASKAFWIQRNGSIIVEYGEDNNQLIPPEHFCVARVATENASVRTDIYVCNKRAVPSAVNIYYSLLFLSGAFFLLLTLLVHAAVPELRRSAHAKALMCHCASLAVAFVALTVGHLQRRYSLFFCAASAFIVQYLFLSTFFWLNVMCFDLTRTFLDIGWTQRNLRGRDRRFLYYSIYAWGCPAVISAITAFFQYASVVSHLPHLPNIGNPLCWFSNRMAEFLYYYLPMMLLLIADVVLFVLAAVRIKGEHRNTSLLRMDHNSRVTQGCSLANQKRPSAARGSGGGGDDGQSAATPPAVSDATANRRMLPVFVKLFCVMGVTWVLEVAAWLGHGGGVPFWLVTDAVNFLRGVLIFVLFCCKPAALRPLRARLSGCALLRCCPRALRWLRAGEGPEGGAGGSSSTQSSGLTSTAPARDTR